MYKTKIDWCDSTWNPVTGCRHKCEYCYARGIANRFGEFSSSNFASMNDVEAYDTTFEIYEKPSNPYPYLFAPTFHQYRLDQPAQWKKPRTIFVCSMADLFGKWVPDEWIAEVFKACEAAPQHRYIFLTKNPDRYIQLAEKGMLPRKHWYGYTATKDSELWRFHHADDCPCINLFVSIEPMLERMTPAFSSHCPADWVIVGAESGSRQDKVIPEREWIGNIQMECEYSGRPIFMKESLRALMGEDFKQEYPWTVERITNETQV